MICKRHIALRAAWYSDFGRAAPCCPQPATRVLALITAAQERQALRVCADSIPSAAGRARREVLLSYYRIDGSI